MVAVDGAAPVIAGIIANSTREVVQRGTALAELGVAALQITPVHYLFRPDDDAMLEFYRAAMEQTGLPVIIYNVVPWSYLAPELLCRILGDVPGVIGVKQSADDNLPACVKHAQGVQQCPAGLRRAPMPSAGTACHRRARPAT